MTTRTTSNVIHISSAKDKDKLLSVTDSREDRFIMAVEEAISALKLATDQVIPFWKEFEALLAKLNEWLRSHSDKVESAFITEGDENLLFVVVCRSAQYDEALERDLTALDVAVADDPQFAVIRLSVLALPKCSDDAIQSFLSVRWTRQLAY